MNWLVALVTALAVYRTALMVATEKGPFSAFENLRAWADRTFKAQRGQHWVSAGVNCPLCISFWLGFIAAPMLAPSNIYEYIVYALGLSGAAVFLIESHKIL